ncbi:hypothetical protein D3C73_1179920 [compost metagenome]
METATPLPMPLQQVMADKAAIWTDIQASYGLANTSYETVSSWAFGDFVFSWDYDFFSDGTKARRLGFNEYIDTEKMFFDLFDELKRQKIIPEI